MNQNQSIDRTDEINEKLEILSTRVALIIDENQKLKNENYKLKSELEEYYYKDNFTHDNPEIKQIVGAVDGTFRRSEQIIKKFIKNVNENNLRITVKDANTIMACYLINRYYYPEEQILLPRKITRGYLECKGAQIPTLMTNQLRGNTGNHSKLIYELLQTQNLLENVDQDLLQAFEIVYGLDKNTVEKMGMVEILSLINEKVDELYNDVKIMNGKVDEFHDNAEVVSEKVDEFHDNAEVVSKKVDKLHEIVEDSQRCIIG